MIGFCGFCNKKTKRSKFGTSLVKKGEFLKFCPGHRSTSKPRLYTEESYKINESGCWIWQGSLNRGGYGQAKFNGKQTSTHRYFYEKYKGPIPNNLTIDHLCRNRACINPDHLEAVTIKENISRGSRVTKTHCKWGHSLADCYYYKGYRNCKSCKKIKDHKRWLKKQEA